MRNRVQFNYDIIRSSTNEPRRRIAELRRYAAVSVSYFQRFYSNLVEAQFGVLIKNHFRGTYQVEIVPSSAGSLGQTRNGETTGKSFY